MDMTLQQISYEVIYYLLNIVLHHISYPRPSFDIKPRLLWLVVTIVTGIQLPRSFCLKKVKTSISLDCLQFFLKIDLIYIVGDRSYKIHNYGIIWMTLTKVKVTVRGQR